MAVFLHHFCLGSNVPLLPAPLKYHVVPDMGGSVNHLFLRTPAQSSVHFFCFNSLIVSTLHHVHNVRARLSRHTQDATSAYKILTAFPRMILSTIWPLLRDSICFPDLHTEFINIETTSFFLFFFYCFSFFLSFQIFSCHICYFFYRIPCSSNMYTMI